MFHYYLTMGLRSLQKNPVLTGLMVLTLAIGVGTCISTLTVLHIMSGDPIPQKSSQLWSPVIDNGPLDDYVAGAEALDDQLTYRDTVNLLAGRQGLRRTAMFGTGTGIESGRDDLGNLQVNGLATTSDFFAMFETPFLFGNAWMASDDSKETQVIVLSRHISEVLFGKVNPVGKNLRMMGNEFHIVGVIDKWHPLPRYYHLMNGNGGDFAGEDDYFIPFRTAIRLHAGFDGSRRCSGERQPGYQGFLDSECTWIQFWFEGKTASDYPALKDYLDAYVSEQKKLGRFMRPANNHLFNVMQWLERQQVVRNDSKLSAYLAFGFLLLCLVNTIGLLMAKFSTRAGEIGVRRALGASRREIFRQFLMESAVIGMAGGVFGLLLAFAGLRLIALQSETMATLAHMDMTMLAVTFLMSVAASIAAGLLPTWRACQVTPALQLKSQ